jgi:hypothetical protein
MSSTRADRGKADVLRAAWAEVRIAALSVTALRVM